MYEVHPMKSKGLIQARTNVETKLTCAAFKKQKQKKRI